MRIGVVARGTHSLHLERGFDTLKRNLSLESRSNIKSWFRVCLWRIRHYDEPIIPKRFLLLLFLTFKNPIFTIKHSSNHLLKVNQIEQLHVGTILSFYYFGKIVHLRFCSSPAKEHLVAWCQLPSDRLLRSRRGSFRWTWLRVCTRWSDR